MALSIAKGERVLGRETKRGTALYLCLKDSYTRIQNRLFELTSEPSENLHFAIMAGTLGGVLERQIENFKSQHKDLKIIIISYFTSIFKRINLGSSRAEPLNTLSRESVLEYIENCE